MRRQVLGLSVYHWGRFEVKVAVGFPDWLFYFLFQESLALLALSKGSAAMSDLLTY